MALVYNQECDFQLYETVITINPSHADVAITSIDFIGAPEVRPMPSGATFSV